jgi:hypothetical protein
MPVTIEANKLDDILKAYSALTGKGLSQITRAHARICAVELANRTQPFTSGAGSGPARLKQSVFYLEKQILRPIRIKQNLDDRFQKIEEEKVRTRLTNLLNAGRYDTIKQILANLKIIKSPEHFKIISGQGELAETHKSRRSTRTGMTYSRPGEINMAKSGVQTYINKVAKAVGYTKSGWAECARKIGGLSGDGARGIPAFAKRQRGNNWKVDDNGASTDNPNFVMTNTTQWIRRLLSASDERDAHRIAREKMIKSMRRAIQQARRGEAAAKQAIAKEVVDAQ